jgi:GxxExxY protein
MDNQAEDEPRRHDGHNEGRDMFEPVSERTEQAVKTIMDAAFQVHRALGPGLLESVYEACLCHELCKLEIPFQRQLEIPVIYDGLSIDAGFRVDLLVDDRVIVELKAIESLLPIHDAQLLTYLKLANKRVGLILNFNVRLLKDGFKRIVL